ncbi:hypothetical protein OAX78_04420, partial [Planctomycetota bacterium]|nr:hypothetical protein [Planctomycetota bacterium]
MNARTTLCAALLSSLCWSGGCAAVKVHFIAGRVIDGLEETASFQGTVREQGILRDQPDTDVVSTVLYERMFKVRAEVTEPADHAGTLFVFDGDTVKIWWPRYFFGLHVSGVTVPPWDQVEDAIESNCYWAVERYDYTRERDGWVAGRPAEVWAGRPSTHEPYVYAYTTSVDESGPMPLAVRVEDRPGHTWYGMRFDALAYDVPVPADAFAFDFPEGAVVFDWDMSDPGVTLEEAQARTQYPILVPSELPEGHSLTKVVMSSYDELEMAALLYQHDGLWLSLSEMPNMGPILVPELGVPVRIGSSQGVLNFVFGYTIISWPVEGTSLTLIGNL